MEEPGQDSLKKHIQAETGKMYQKVERKCGRKQYFNKGLYSL